MTTMLGEVEVDGRGRVSLGRFGKTERTRYVVSEDDRGVLTLTPVHSLPVTDLPDWLARSMAQADRGQGGPRPEFTK
ncbi:hypothetical protein DVS28_b0012 (plasmid) [Euzebya pacifica]|uniref:Uncharacterized protein n=1 Tax=Euzebya pacifica TaxID=1608957 RepID=A0A346Y5N5_9ACTN|nr:hypothetical protein [Euzebya pacifica]AXV09782.1 hypothetical protein DVS28_b0012 [Euzebya pacifica]